MRKLMIDLKDLKWNSMLTWTDGIIIKIYILS